MANWLFTGGTGFLGAKLIDELVYPQDSVVVLTRTPNKYKSKNNNVAYIGSFEEISSEHYFDYVINLSGYPIADRPWSTKVKKQIYSSRVIVTKELVNLLSRLNTPPQVMISASAIGYYGHSETQEYTENSAPSNIFISKLCHDWEQEASKVQELGVRLVTVRTGVVLAKGKGILQKMYLPFYFGLGGKIGTGNQYLSWIHIKDYLEVIKFALSDPTCPPVINATAPSPVKNIEFTKALASALNRPAFIPVPSFIVKLIFGEMGENLLLKGQKVLPSALISVGYRFIYSNINSALKDIYK